MGRCWKDMHNVGTQSKLLKCKMNGLEGLKENGLRVESWVRREMSGLAGTLIDGTELMTTKRRKTKMRTTKRMRTRKRKEKMRKRIP